MKRTFLQKIARFILRDELREKLKIRREERRVLRSFKSLYEDKYSENQILRNEIYGLKRVRCFVPDFMFDAMIKSLPDPNKVGKCLGISDLHHGSVFEVFGTDVNGHKEIVHLQFKKICTDYVEILFVDINLRVKIPLCEKSINIEMNGVNHEVNSFVWNLNESHCAIISYEAYISMMSMIECSKFLGLKN